MVYAWRMPWLEHDGLKFCVGRHATLGLLVFRAQEVRSAGPDITGFNVIQKKVGKFKIAIIRTKIQSTGITEDEARAAVELFVATAPTGFSRVTHCWSCTSTISTASTNTCPKCRWIRCACSACSACGCHRPDS